MGTSVAVLRCAVCRSKLPRSRIGRPRRYHSKACRQAAYRARVTKVEAPRTAEEALREIGFTGEKLLTAARAVAKDHLRRKAATLGDREDDLVSHLVEVGLKVALRYDPARVRPGYAAASLMWDVMSMRTADFYRRHSEGFGDRRAGTESRIVLDAEPENHEQGEWLLEEQDDQDILIAVETISTNAHLSPSAWWALLQVAGPLAEGASLSETAALAGVSTHRARRALEELRVELAGARGCYSVPQCTCATA